MESIRCFEIFELDCLSSYFEDRAVAKELGTKPQLKHKHHRRWMVAMSGNNIAGFVAINPIKNCTFPFKGVGVELKHFYILPDYRRQGIGSKLLTKAIKTVNCNIKAVILPNTAEFYQKHGFVRHGNRGKYPIVARLI